MLRLIAWSNQAHPMPHIRRLASGKGSANDFAKYNVYITITMIVIHVLRAQRSKIFDKIMSPTPPVVIQTSQDIMKDLAKSQTKPWTTRDKTEAMVNRINRQPKTSEGLSISELQKLVDDDFIEF